MSDTTTDLREQRRKRVRKGTKSCWECKRRKVRCDFLDAAVCTACADRGSKCVSQELDDDQVSSSGALLGERMGRVEMLLEKLMQKVDANGMEIERDHDSAVPEAKENLGIDVLTPASSASNQYENAPILSLFDNSVFGRGPVDGPSVVTPMSASQAVFPINQTRSKLERLRRTLTAILPSQHDIDLLSDASDGWRSIKRQIMPRLMKLPDHGFSKPISVRVVSESHPIVITRLLLAVAICIQELPHDYNQRALQLVGSLQDLKEKIITMMATITSDDELIGSLEGVECLILQGSFHVNAGNLRRSWLCFRRAISVAQLMGLHRPSFRPIDPGDLQVTRRHYLWFQLVKSDRFLSLILGVPSLGGTSEQFPFDDLAAWLSPEDKYAKQLSTIAGLIIDRNQVEPTHAFSVTQNIEEKLSDIARQMPGSWWEFSTPNELERKDGTAKLYERALSHIWHFELESLLHLPYMLRAAMDRRYEYSRLSCLSASRKLIRRWIFLRECIRAPFVCKVIEFQAFTAAITLLLGILQPTQIIRDPLQIQVEEEDRKLADKVRQIFDELQTSDRDVIFKQSAEVLKTLQCIDRNNPGKTGNIRLTIPHFGTISVRRSHPNLCTKGMGPAPTMQERASASFQVDPAMHHWQNDVRVMQPVSYLTSPLLTFTSSQFTPLAAEMGEWPFSEDDTLLFDSLLSTDLEGDWNLNFQVK